MKSVNQYSKKIIVNKSNFVSIPSNRNFATVSRVSALFWQTFQSFIQLCNPQRDINSFHRTNESVCKFALTSVFSCFTDAAGHDSWLNIGEGGICLRRPKYPDAVVCCSTAIKLSFRWEIYRIVGYYSNELWMCHVHASTAYWMVPKSRDPIQSTSGGTWKLVI